MSPLTLTQPGDYFSPVPGPGPNSEKYPSPEPGLGTTWQLISTKWLNKLHYQIVLRSNLSYKHNFLLRRNGVKKFTLECISYSIQLETWPAQSVPTTNQFHFCEPYNYFFYFSAKWYVFWVGKMQNTIIIHSYMFFQKNYASEIARTDPETCFLYTSYTYEFIAKSSKCFH